MIVGYSRIALFQPQSQAEEQVAMLLNYGCLEEHIYQEQTAAQDLRGQLRLALNALRKGDKLVLCKLSALGATLGELSAAFLEIDRRFGYFGYWRVADGQRPKNRASDVEVTSGTCGFAA